MEYLNGKIALVTGGARGIGFACIQEFLRNGIQGVTLIDFNAEQGKRSEKLFNEEFGEGKVIFIEADISNKQQFKDAFETSIKHWKNLDIVVNNAGIVDEVNWETLLLTNSGGTLNGTLLGFKYMSKSRNGHGGVIMNIGSVTGLIPFNTLPIYSATKSFIITLSRALGDPIYFEYNAVKVLTACPGKTTTDIVSSLALSTDLCADIQSYSEKNVDEHSPQTPEEFAKHLMIILKKGSNGSVWHIAENRAVEVNFSNIDEQCN